MADFNRLHINKLEELVKTFSDDEFEAIMKYVPDDFLWDELMKRDNFIVKKINYMQEILGVRVDNLQAISAKSWQEIRSCYDEMQEKYNNLRKELFE